VSTSPTLRVTQIAGDAAAAVVSLTGAIDEKFDSSMLSRVQAPITILQLDGVTRITSFGVRQWSEAMKNLPPQIRHLYIVGASPSFIDQLNMVLNFGGRAEVITANGVFFCPKCDDERVATIDVFADKTDIAAGRVGDLRCNVCSGPLQLEDDPFAYLRFAVTYGAKSIEPQALALLTEAGLYRVREEGRPPDAAKLVHGDVTLLTLSGTLDQRFQPRRLASGIEGEVVFDLSAVEAADATGCERWSRLLGQLGNATQIVVVELPPPLWQQAADGRFKIEGTTLHSVRAEHACPVCHTKIIGPLTPQAFHGSPRKCTNCGRALTLKSDAALIERVLAAARASMVPISPAVDEVVSRRGDLVAQARQDLEESSGRKSGTVSPTRYKLVKQLGQGGMGEILLAIQQSIGGFEKLVAVKKIRRDVLAEKQVATELFLAEAKLAANLNHPNIVQIFEIGQQGGDLFIAMEYIHGADVRTMLRDLMSRADAPPLPLEAVLYIGMKVASALHHAHVATDLAGKPLQIVHRDVSPSNIVIGFDGQVKLVDFGIAVVQTPPSESGEPAPLIGKVSYMSPEQVSGQSLDGRSDVFSLGVVLYELITRKYLFRRDSDQHTTRAVWVDPLPSLKDYGVPPFVEEVLARALVRMRDKRYPDAHAFEVALGEALTKLKSTASNATVASLLTSMFPEKSATPPVDRGTAIGGRPRTANYLDVVPVDEETAPSEPGVVRGPKPDTSPGMPSLKPRATPSSSMPAASAPSPVAPSPAVPSPPVPEKAPPAVVAATPAAPVEKAPPAASRSNVRWIAVAVALVLGIAIVVALFLGRGI
jgi:serine/threonine protein kinase